MKEFYDMKEEIKNSKQKFKLYIKRCCLQCCLRCWKNMERSKNGTIMLLSKCALCDSKKIKIY